MCEYFVAPLPYCDGCSHRLIAAKFGQALISLHLDPLDVVVVSDIGCHGMIDKSLATHTVHGLHGRSVAMGAGISMGLPSNKKVVVFIGDGGATIGLQHLLEAARRNIDITVVVHNNMLYGMTGGQPSGLTLPGYRTVITPEGNPLRNYDLCQLVLQAGAAYVQRVISGRDLTHGLQKALMTEGFTLVEVLGTCIERGKKLNQGNKIRDLVHQTGLKLGDWTGELRPGFRLTPKKAPSLLTELKETDIKFTSPVSERLEVVLGGSAGEGVQKAAELFARAALASGLHVTKKGSYPTTVGVGYSTAELILSCDPIDFHGITRPDVVVITSQAGLNQVHSLLQELASGTVWSDRGVWQAAAIKLPKTGFYLKLLDLRARVGPKNAALYGVLCCVYATGIIPFAALVEEIRQDPIYKYIPQELCAAATYQGTA